MVGDAVVLVDVVVVVSKSSIEFFRSF
jgi:hypothetical protein